jgi:hypothetical protein
MRDQIDIEQIVREVLAKLGTDVRPQPPLPSADRLELRDKLVTLATLENQLTGIRSLVLPRGAVVTPSARDELRVRRVQVSYAAGTSQPAVKLVLGVADLEQSAVNLDVASFADALARDFVAIERVAATGLAGVVAELADHAARGGRPALLLTGRPEAAACLANREHGVRAVGGRDPSGMKRAIVEVAANFLAVDAAMPPAVLRRIVQEFCAGWPRSVPDIFNLDLPGS